MEIQAFEVGGIVRDEIMGVPSKDVDYTVIAPSYEAMRQFVLDNGMRIVVENPKFYTIRAVARTPFQGRAGGLDFVWARVEGPYSDGRRPDWVRPGTLFQDLKRRDFCFNAIAKAVDGSYIDPFYGQQDIKDRKIRAVGNAEDRIREDALRGLRAIRFSVTKGFTIDPEITGVLKSNWFPEALDSVSVERIREEMFKAFKADTSETLSILGQIPDVRDVIFTNGMWLKPTMEE